MGLLVLAVLIGFLCGFIRARVNRVTYDINDLSFAWLVPIAYIPQLLAFQLPYTRELIPTELASIILVSTQFVLVYFVWRNRWLPGFSILGVGLTLNLVVILVNGGLMPISPETASNLFTDAPHNNLKTGVRFGFGKDILLTAEETRLVWLSDKFILPACIPYRSAYSIGDVLISAGVFVWLWSFGKTNKKMTLRRA